jgi:A nuclease family of the HNH/ENDO VII superfamily with conserved AHH
MKEIQKLQIKYLPVYSIKKVRLNTSLLLSRTRNKKVVYFEVSVKDQVKIHENYKIVQDRVNAVEKSVDEINKANPVSQFIMGAVDGVKDNIVGTATMIMNPLETLGAIKDVAVALSSLTAEDVGKIAEAVKGKISDTFTTKDGINSIPYGAGYAVGMLATDIVVGKGVGIALKGLKGIPAISKLLTKLEDLKLATQGKIAETFSNDAASLAKENFIKRMKVIGANPNNITNIALDPELWANATKVAGNTLAKGYKSFAEFSAKMVDELGEAVKPYLEKLHREGLTTLDLKPDFINAKEVEKFLGKAVKEGDKLPDGYNWNNGQIVRSPNKAEAGYMPLKLENGKIAEREGTDRLSKPTVMNRNFEKSIKDEIKAKNPNYTEKQVEAEFKLVKARVQIHHIIPDDIVQTSELGKAAQKAGYDLDDASNLKGMPRDASKRANEFDVEHRGSHPKYSNAVRRRIEKVEVELKEKYKTLDKVPPEILKQKMKDIENEFRLKIETNDKSILIKDGKLALMQNQLNGGRNDVRV